MNWSIYHAVAACRGLKFIERALLRELADFSNEQNPYQPVFPGIDTLAERTNLHKITVSKLLSSLQKKGMIVQCGMHKHTKQYQFVDETLHFSAYDKKGKLKVVPREEPRAATTSGANALQPRAPGPDHSPAQDEPPDDFSDLVDDFPEMGEPPEEDTQQSTSNVLHFPSGHEQEIGPIMPPESARWNAETMVQAACAIGGYTVSGQELARERDAAQQLLTLSLSNNNYQPLDRALFESIYRFEWERGELAERFMHPLRLADFARNPATADIAIKLYRQRQAEQARKEALDTMTAEQRFLALCEKTGDTANPAYKRLKGIAEEPALTYAPRPSTRPAPRGQRATASAGGFERASGGFDWLDSQVRLCKHLCYDQIHAAASARGYTGEQITEMFKKYRPGELPTDQEQEQEESS